MAYIDPDTKVEARRAEIIAALTQNPAIWDRYKEYKKSDVEHLIKSYSLQKARVEVHGNYTHFHHDYLIKEWNERVWFALGEIQQKKLFDLQCRWRAGEVEVPCMDTSHEFQYLPVPLMDLDIIPAITPEEVETYRNYLKTPNGTITQYAYYNGYQDHSSIKKSRDADGNGEMPNYYEYHYMVTGNTGLLLLPDLIGQEEERLIDVAWDCMEKWKLMEPVKNAKPVQKYLSYYSDEEQISLAQFLGDKHVVTFIRDMSTWTKEKPDMEVEWAMEYLSFCYPDPVPMLAAPTWQEGIQNTVLQHITQKVYERLPLIYEEYTLKKQLGIPIGYIEGESPRKRKPYPVMWIELARKVEKGIPVDRNEFLADKMW